MTTKRQKRRVVKQRRHRRDPMVQYLIEVDRYDGSVVQGNQRVAAARAMGVDTITVKRESWIVHFFRALHRSLRVW